MHLALAVAIAAGPSGAADAQPDDAAALGVQRQLLQRPEYLLLARLYAEHGFDRTWLAGADGQAAMAALVDAHGVRMSCSSRIASNACAKPEPDRAPVLYFLLNNAFLQFDGDAEAIEFLDAPVEQAKVAEALAKSLRDRAVYGKSIEALLAAGARGDAPLGPRGLRERVEQAQSAAAAQQWERTSALLMTAHALGARDPAVFYNSGLAQARLGRDAAAIAWLYAYLAAAPDAADAARVRESAESLRKRLRRRADLLFDEAVAAAERAQPAITPWAVLANAKADGGDLPAARKYLRHVEDAAARGKQDAQAVQYYLEWASNSGDTRALNAAARELGDPAAHDGLLTTLVLAHLGAGDILAARQAARLMGAAHRPTDIDLSMVSPPGPFSPSRVVDLWTQRARSLSHPGAAAGASEAWLMQARSAVNTADAALFLGRAAWTAQQGLVELAATEARARRLQEAGAQVAQFEQALASGNARRIGALLQKSAWLVNARGGDGLPALHRAAYVGDAALSRQLLAAGADVSGLSIDGLQPLHFAVRSEAGARAVMRLLLDAGASPDRQSPQGRTPMHYAVLELSGEVLADALRALVETDANPHLADDWSISAYDLALRKDEKLAALLARPAATAAMRAFSYRGEAVDVPQDALFDVTGLVADASVADAGFGPAVLLTLTPEGTARLGEITARLAGRRIALLLDGEIIQLAVLHEQIRDGKVSIAGLQRPEEAESLVRALKAARR